jgi:endonuclease/exonuclease/phosphatase family metal-dependent hydrolase
MRAEGRNSFAALIAIVLLAGCGSNVRQAQEPDGPHLRVMTYNVNYGLPPQWGIEVIEKADADVVCLQETTPFWERSLRERLAQRYPHMLFRHESAAGGMAILSRQPIEEVFYDQPPGGWFHGWAVTTGTALGLVQLLNVHLHPPLNEHGSASPVAYLQTPQTRRGEIEFLHQKLDSTLPTIVLGDFNENDTGDALRYLSEQGLANCLGQFDRRTNTWRWQTSVLSLTGRYDHILYSPQLKCFSAKVVAEGSSDHLPVMAVLGARD